MKLYYFSEMPHHEFPDEEGDKYPSLRLEFPNRFFDREKAAAKLPALPHGVRVRRPGGLRRPHDQRASLDAVVCERRCEP